MIGVERNARDDKIRPGISVKTKKFAPACAMIGAHMPADRSRSHR